VRQWPASNGVSVEAEEFPLLEAIMRTSGECNTENTSVCVTVNCKVWRLAMAL
jgi:hypothetical protein